jgi:hypothetical protein
MSLFYILINLIAGELGLNVSSGEVMGFELWFCQMEQAHNRDASGALNKPVEQELRRMAGHIATRWYRQLQM